MKSLLLGMLILARALVYGQEGADSASTRATIIVHSSPDSAWVFLDSAFAGRTPCTLFVNAPMTHSVKVFHPDLTNWLSGVFNETLDVSSGDTLVRHYVIEEWAVVASTPQGANVFLGDSLLGTTPLLVSYGRIKPEQRLDVRKAGYEPASSLFGNSSRGILTIPLMASRDPNVSAPLLETEVRERSALRIYLAGAGVLVAGAASAYLKARADTKDDEFRRTGNPSNADDRKRLDNQSAVLLVAAEVCFGLLVGFLLSE